MQKAMKTQAPACGHAAVGFSITGAQDPIFFSTSGKQLRKILGFLATLKHPGWFRGPISLFEWKHSWFLMVLDIEKLQLGCAFEKLGPGF